ncbi:MAG: LysR family transcriptional regulator, partial [Propionivibrio sp.]|nr:LysR family transcriptional regulator [Propionivibrio sp.]
MELRDLRAFATLGELLHFGQAAERMHVTQSALSKQIQRLEGEFGGALFERGQAGTRLTPLGRALHAEAQTIVDGVHRFSHRARQAAQGVLGTLRIGFGVTSRTIAPAAISRFRAIRPDVQIELMEVSARHQIQAMREGTMDIGFCRLPVPEGWPTLHCIQANLVAVLPSDYGEQLSLEELVRRPMVTIARTRSPAFHDHVMSYLTRKGLRIQALQTTTDFYTAVALAEAGVAWAIVPSSTPYEPTRACVKILGDE